MDKTALIIGAGGQDGYFLALHLLEKGYKVIGGVRRSSQPRNYLLPIVEKGVELVECDITDYSNLEQVIKKYQPEQVYNLSAMSHVGTSFSQPLYTWDVVAKGVLNLLEIIRHNHPEIKIYQASSSEMFGKSTSVKKIITGGERDEFTGIISDIICTEIKYQDENTIFTPQSPYSIAKLAGHEAVRLYRESYGLFACSGILFNHESERRGENFVTRKITRYVGKLKVWLAEQKRISESVNKIKEMLQKNISGGCTELVWGPDLVFEEGMSVDTKPIKLISNIEFPKLKLGNIYSYRDWSHAEDLVRAMVLMLEADKPDDYVVGSGETHTVEEFLVEAFTLIGVDWKDWVEIDQSLIRPAEVDYLRANPEKVKRELGWKPEISFKRLVERMVNYDIHRAEEKARLYGI